MHISAEDFEAKDVILLQDKGALDHQIPFTGDFFNISLVLKGLSDQLINEHQFQAKSRSVYLVSPGQLHAAQVNGQPYEAYVLLFERSFIAAENISGKILDEMLDFDELVAPYFPLDAKGFTQIIHLFKRLDFELKEQGPFHRQLLRILINELLYLLQREKTFLAQQAREKTPRREVIVSQFKKLIEIHFRQEKLVQQYANRMELTSKHLSETVKEVTGQTALQWIHQRMQREAEFLLAYTDKNVKEISASMEFDTSSHFGRFFRQKRGMSPLAFRKEFKPH